MTTKKWRQLHSGEVCFPSMGWAYGGLHRDDLEGFRVYFGRYVGFGQKVSRSQQGLLSRSTFCNELLESCARCGDLMKGRRRKRSLYNPL